MFERDCETKIQKKEDIKMGGILIVPSRETKIDRRVSFKPLVATFDDLRSLRRTYELRYKFTTVGADSREQAFRNIDYALTGNRSDHVDMEKISAIGFDVSCTIVNVYKLVEASEDGLLDRIRRRPYQGEGEADFGDINAALGRTISMKYLAPLNIVSALKRVNKEEPAHALEIATTLTVIYLDDVGRKSKSAPFTGRDGLGLLANETNTIVPTNYLLGIPWFLTQLERESGIDLLANSVANYGHDGFVDAKLFFFIGLEKVRYKPNSEASLEQVIDGFIRAGVNLETAVSGTIWDYGKEK